MLDFEPDKKTEKTVIFRTDGGSDIGMGHIYRCLSIADALMRNDINCIFMLSSYEFTDFIVKKGFGVINLNSDRNEIDTELYMVKRYIRNSNIPVIIVDSYDVTENYLTELRKAGKVVYLDDLLRFPYDVDYLINYNMYADVADYEKLYLGKEKPVLLLGTGYAPLRIEFEGIKRGSVNKEVKEILVSTGGADTENVAVRLANHIKENNEDDHIYHFVVGSASPYHKELSEISKDTPNIIIHKDEQAMSVLMMKCDLAVSASGSTLYELCACGLPAVTYVVADNQIRGAEIFKEKGYMISVGDIRGRDDICSEIIRAVKELAADHDKRKAMSEKMQTAVDGMGSLKIAKQIIEKLF